MRFGTVGFAERARDGGCGCHVCAILPEIHSRSWANVRACPGSVPNALIPRIRLFLDAAWITSDSYPVDVGSLTQAQMSADDKGVTWWMVVFLMQSAQTQAERIRASMADSLAAQRASVHRQIEKAGPARRQSNAPNLAESFCEAIVQPELIRMIDLAAQHQSVDPRLVREVARQESGFRPCAVSPSGAQGLMQLMPQTQIQLKVQNPFDAQESLEAGTKLLKQLLDRYDGDLTLALSAYNAGPGRVDKAGGVPEIPETQKYVSNILNRLLPAPDIRPEDDDGTAH